MSEALLAQQSRTNFFPIAMMIILFCTGLVGLSVCIPSANSLTLNAEGLERRSSLSRRQLT